MIPTPASTWEVRRRYFPAVEGLRAAAALLVLVGHVLVLCYLPTGGLRLEFGFAIASFGVTAFFAISGFLLYRPFLAARRSGQAVGALAPRYFLRRGVRIFPAYWVALTVLAIWPGLVGVFSDQWWIYYGLLQVYAPHHQTDGLTVAWTLGTEISFYLLLPVIAAALASRGLGSGNRRALSWELGLLLGLGLASVLFQLMLGITQRAVFLQATILGTFVWFSAGMALAAIEVERPPALERLRRLLSRPEVCWPLALALFLLLPFKALEFGPPSGALKVLDGGLAAALFVAPAMLAERGRLVHPLLANRLSIFLGTVSYGIYLWHLPILIWLHSTVVFTDSRYPVLTLGLAAVAAAVALGAASWYLIERPLMRRVRSVKAFADIRHRDVEVSDGMLPPGAPPPLVEPAAEEGDDGAEPVTVSGSSS